MYWVSLFPSAGCHKGHYSHDGAAEDVVVVSATRIIPEADPKFYADGSSTDDFSRFLFPFKWLLR
jgi:hypothetical protein